MNLINKLCHVGDDAHSLEVDIVTAHSMFAKLFEPIQLGRMEVKNRVVMAPVATPLWSGDGTASERLRDFFKARADGGVGLIILGATLVSPGPLQRIDDDKFIPGLRQVVASLHDAGAKAALQLYHLGAVEAMYSPEKGDQSLAPSGLPAYPGGPNCKEMTTAEIRGVVQSFALAAERAKQAGFDAVELHAAHGYLIAQFISPLFNKRTDGYGGDVTRRGRFVLEIVKAIKAECGKDYPVIVRVSGEEYEEGGVKIGDTKLLACLLEEAGADAIHISYGTQVSPVPLSLAPACYPEGVLVHLAEQVKSVVNIPVIAVGKIKSPHFAEKVLQDGKADLIALGRALLADPEWPKKAEAGALADIRPCIGCNYCLLGMIDEPIGIKCTVNAAVGREEEYRIRKAEQRKKVVAVGGGPAGMEASRVAALRGHEVMLYEKQGQLGGQLLLARIPPYKDDMEELRDYLINQLGRLSIDIRLGEEFRVEELNGIRPDVVILATGVIPFVPEIPGIDGENVLTVEEVLSGREVGERVVVIGGELVGCETAEFLADRGKKVTIMRRGKEMATRLEPMTRSLLMRRLRQKGVEMVVGVRAYEQITERKLVFVNEHGLKESREFDTLVLACGALADDKLLQELGAKVAEIRMVGDCVKPRNLLSAIHEGAAVARQI